MFSSFFWGGGHSISHSLHLPRQTHFSPASGFGEKRYCYWVGSLDFNLLDSPKKMSCPFNQQQVENNCLLRDLRHSRKEPAHPEPEVARNRHLWQLAGLLEYEPLIRAQETRAEPGNRERIRLCRLDHLETQALFFPLAFFFGWVDSGLWTS